MMPGSFRPALHSSLPSKMSLSVICSSAFSISLKRSFSAKPSSPVSTSSNVPISSKLLSKRNFISFLGKKKLPNEPKVLVDSNNLFHPLSSSPIPALVQKSQFIKEHANCPVCASQDLYRPPIYECQDCGFPTHCSHLHYISDIESHQRICGILKEANMDEHDLRSGRFMKEFEFPGPQSFDETINLGSWDVFLYTRSFPSIDNDRSLRHISKILSHPLTIASILHENSPYKLSNSRLTNQGLRSITALRQNLYRIKNEKLIKVDNNDNKIRIFILGARAESTLPFHIWKQLSFLFPGVTFHLHMIGPEIPSELIKKSETGLDIPYSITSQLQISFHQCLYHDLHQFLSPFDPYTDIFFTFSPGLGHPATSHMWKSTLPLLFETKCLIIGTGYDDEDVKRDIEMLENSGLEFDWALPPGENVFSSRKWEINDWNLYEAIRSNWGLWGVRGKLYEVSE